MATRTEAVTRSKTTADTGHDGSSRAQPLLQQRAREIQPYGTVARLPIGLDEKVCQASVESLNQVLADTMTLRDLYKKHHWQVAGHTFYQLHLLFDKHAEEQEELIDLIAERVQSLGAISVGDPRHAAEITRIERPPDGSETPRQMIGRLLAAHERMIEAMRDAIDRTARNGDWGTNDLLMSDVLRRHEMQVWFLAEHLVDVPVVAK